MSLTWVKVNEDDKPFRYDAIPGMDPGANWYFGPGMGAFLPEGEEDAVIPTLFYLNFFPDSDGENQFNIWNNDLDLVPWWLRAALVSDQDVSPYPIAKSDFDDLVELFSNLNPELLDVFPLNWAFRFTSPHAKSSFPVLTDPPEIPVGPPPAIPNGGWPEGTVVMAVIDDSLCFAHDAFRDSIGKTRVQYWWRQDGPEPDTNNTVLFGQEIGKNPVHGRPGIDQLLDDFDSDEAIYRGVGLLNFRDPQRSTATLSLSHGTHVMDIAAGYNPGDEDKTRPIIAVQLPSEVVEKTSGAELEYYVVAAVDYIVERARNLTDGDRLPLIINLSYGFAAGPHDGTTNLEVALDQRLQTYGFKEEPEPNDEHWANMVLSAGNSHLSRCHGEFCFYGDPSGEVHELEWMVLPDDRTSSYLEIWLPYDEDIGTLVEGQYVDDDRISVSVIAPTGEAISTPVGGKHGCTVRLVRNGSTSSQDVAAEVKYSFVQGETMRGMFRVTLAPTEQLAGDDNGWGDHALAPSGKWLVRIHRGTLAAYQQVNVWVQRDDTIYGFPPRGRQSFFINDRYKVFDDQGRPIVEDENGDQDAIIRRRALVSAAATGENIIVAGGFRETETTLADYSAGEPTTPKRDNVHIPGASHKPDAAMVSDTSQVHHGVLAAGSLSGSVTWMNGTSVAAPGLARRLADHHDLGTKDGRTIIKEIAQECEGSGGPFETSPEINRERRGWGRIDPKANRIKVRRVY